jgi:uncharacterized protein
MSAEAPYLDTSALAKRYLNEAGSEDFVAFASRWQTMATSRLTALEFGCLLGRRRRNGDLSDALEREVVAAFEEDTAFGHLDVVPVRDQHLSIAWQLLQRPRQHPLRTVDALHLAIARDAAAVVLATAARILSLAAADLGFEVARFGAGAR